MRCFKNSISEQLYKASILREDHAWWPYFMSVIYHITSQMWQQSYIQHIYDSYVLRRSNAVNTIIHLSHVAFTQMMAFFFCIVKGKIRLHHMCTRQRLNLVSTVKKTQ